MIKRYLIYWDNNQGVDGNTIFGFDPKEVVLVDLVNSLLENINEKDPSLNLRNLSIKFMMELK